MISFLPFDSAAVIALRVERHDPFDLEKIGGYALLVCQLLYRLLDDPFSRAPTQ